MTGITSVTATPSTGDYNASNTVTFTLLLDGSVTVTGTPHLDLSGGETAVYDAGSSTANSLSFLYTVQAGDNAPSLDVTGLALNGGSILDGGNAPLDLTNAATPFAGLQIDTTAPAAPAILALDPATDTGISASDGITKNQTPIITGTAEAGDTVTLYDTDTITVIGTTTADSGGNWTIHADFSSEPDGGHTLFADSTDGAGNVSQPAQPFAITIDTTAPVAPTNVALASSSDSGTPGDDITNDTTPTITGTAEDGDTVTLYDTDGTTVLGTTTANASTGAWTINSTTLTDSNHTLTVKSTDTAGNVSPSSASLTVNIDTAAPVQPTGLAFAPGSDSGTQGDGITKLTTPAISGVAGLGDHVTLYDSNGTTVLGTATADGTTGDWTITASTLAQGTHTLTVKSTDTVGNSSVSAPFPITIDSTPPAIPTGLAFASGSDSGIQNDGTTNVTTPTITGTATPSSTVNLFVDGGTTSIGSVTANPVNGAWSIASTATLAPGPHSFTADSSDAADNVSLASTAFSITIDTTRPAAPMALTLAPGSDSGTQGDDITNHVVPTITGTADPGDTVTLFGNDSNSPIGSTTATGTGTWSITSNVTLSQGITNFTAKSTDSTGNDSVASMVLPVNIQTTPPLAPTALALDASSDNGLVGDGITNDATPTITGHAGLGDTVTLYDTDGTAIGSDVADGTTGDWSITPGTALHDEVGSFTAKSTDIAGNQSVASTSLPITIDTVAPHVSALAAATGSSDLNAGQMVTLTVTLSKPVTVDTTGGIPTLALDDGGTATYSGFTAPNTLTFTYVVAAGENSSNLTVTSANLHGGTILDDAGNAADLIGASLLPTGVQIDTDPPAVNAVTASPSAGDLNAGQIITLTVVLNEAVNVDTTGGTPRLLLNDGGTADYFGGTGTDTLTFRQTVAPGQNASNLALNNVDLNGGTIRDAAGNDVDLATTNGLLSNGPQIDTIAPTVTGITTSPASGDLGAGQTVVLTVSLSEVVTVVDSVSHIPTLTLDNGGTATYGGGSGTNTLTFNYSVQPGNDTAHLSGATAALNGATILDGAGNPLDLATASGQLSGGPQIDTVAPTAPIPVLAAASDSGSSSSDHLTNVTTPIITGSGEDGDVVTLLDNGITPIGTVTVVGNAWSITTAPLIQGTNSITATQTDGAGNISPISAPLVVTLDTTAPTVTANLTSDTGVSTTDGITSSDALTGTAEAGGQVTVKNGPTTLGTVMVDPQGGWTFTPSKLPDGPYNLTVSQTDAAGNIGTTPVAFTLDATAPSAPGTPVLSAISDSGSSSSDNLTSVSTPVITGTGETGDQVFLFGKGGVPLGSGVVSNGTWSITATALAQGINAITATQTDPAGNGSVASSALNVTLDTIAPVAPVALALTTASDSGSSHSDNLTNVVNPVVTGTGETGATVKLFDNGSTLVGTGTVVAGSWSITTTTALTNGSNALTATQTDAAGNTSVTSVPLSVVLDTTAPIVTAALVADTGISHIDGVTSNDSLAGTAEPGGTVTISNGGNVVATTKADQTGMWHATPVLSDGTYTLTASQTDDAGNLGSVPITFSLDTNAPVAPGTPVLLTQSDSGSSQTDGITKVTTPRIRGTGVNGSTITLFDNNNSTIIGTGTVSSGTWTITAAGLNEGTNSITAVQSDVAGNTSSASGALVINLDTTAPDAPSAPVLETSSDSGTSDEDNLTQVATPVLRGTGESGTTVSLFDNDSILIGTAMVIDGAWSLTADALTEGTNTITAEQTDLAGNISSSSNPLVVTLDTIAPVVTGVTASPSDATLRAGQTVSFTVGLSEAVTINASTGRPTLALSDGATAAYVSGSGTNALVFSYTVAAGQAAADLAVTGINLNGSMMTDAAGNAANLAGAATNPHGTLTIAAVTPTGEFDAAYYLAHNPDVAAAGVDPAQHYATVGWTEGRNPDAFFNTNYYLNQNPDVAAAGIDPLTQYEVYGWKEGRDPSADFSTRAYLQANPDVAAAGIDPLMHYLASGASEGRLAFIAQPHGVGEQNPLVDNAYYFAQNPDVRAAGINPFTHYDASGWQEGRNPDALFNTTYYLQQNPDVAAAHIDPLLHYEQSGWLEGRNPSADFSTNAYLNANPDIRAAGINPLVHYEEYGMHEGRQIFHV